MKGLKIFMLAVASVILASCSDDDSKWNSAGDVQVAMGSTEITWKENKGTNTPVFVPITVTGERNGAVQVTVSVAETGSNPAMDDVHYIITSKTIVIPADANEGQIELRTIDDSDVNENRTFTMTITSAHGASIGTSASTLITLKDNDSEFYEKLMGGWKMTASDDEGKAYEWNVSIDGFDEGEPGYNESLWLAGFDGESGTIELKYEFDMATGKGRVGVIVPSDFFAAYSFNGIGPHYLGLSGYDLEAGKLLNDEFVIWGTWNDEFTEVTFDETAPAVAERLYTYPDGDPTNYLYAVYKIHKLKR